jgi:hypothetical protein
VLSTALPLFYHQTDAEMRTMTARRFGAVRNAIRSLKAYYESLKSGTPMDIERRAQYPYPCQYMPLDGSEKCRFKYRSQLDKLIFFGEADNGDIICIKFVRQYSKEVHLHCASLGFAPALRAFESIPGGWYMVVMDALDKEYVMLSSISIDRQILDDIRAKVMSIHQAGFVHGDIRDANLMVKRKQGGPFMLIYFDWAGKIEEVRYPIDTDRGDGLWRPDGASDGNFITVDHDIQMLEYLFQHVKLLD